MKRIVTTEEWRDMRGLCVPRFQTDYNYAKVAERLLNEILQADVCNELGEEVCYHMAATLTCYFEDVISNFGIWNCFVRKHKEMYGKVLPFYDINEDEYCYDDINPEDIFFLVWMVSQKMNSRNSFYNPENPAIISVGCKLYEILYDLFETTPVNEYISEKYLDRGLFDDIYKLKFVLMDLAESCYLFSLFTDEVIEDFENVVDNLGLESGSQKMYAIRSRLAFDCKTGPLRLPVWEWYSMFLHFHGYDKESSVVKNIRVVEQQLFQLCENRNDCLVLKDIRGSLYNVNKCDFNSLENVQLDGTPSCSMSLVEYKGEWYPNGLTSWNNSKDVFNEYVKYIEEKENVELNRELRRVNNGYPLMYIKDYGELSEFFKTNFKVADNLDIPAELRDKTYFLLYIPEKGALNIIPDAARIVKDCNNPYYDAEYAESNSLYMLTSENTTSNEMLHYLIENRMMPDMSINSVRGVKRGKQLLQENMDFLARFMRKWY